MSKFESKRADRRGHAPTIYTDELAEKVCERLAEGQSLRQIVNAPDMPSRITIYRWVRDNPDFRALYYLAREEQAETHADEIIEIADTEPDAAKARVRVDARKWVASKLKPRRYGDRLEVDMQSSVSSPELAKAASTLDNILGLLAAK